MFHVCLAIVLAFGTHLRTCTSQNCSPVEVGKIVTTLSSSKEAIAGQTFSFTVELFGTNQQPVCDYYDPYLTVECVGDAGKSFCEPGPHIRPVGIGIYNVTIFPTTFWTSHLPWPPELLSAPLSADFFTGITTVHVKYNTTHVPGSPFMLNVAPAETSTSTSTVDSVDPPFILAGIKTTVARFYQITDRFTNWIRGREILSKIRVQCTSPDVVTEVIWWSNIWVEIRMLSDQAGDFTFQVFLTDHDGNEEPLRVRGANGLSYFGHFKVWPGRLDTRQFVVNGLPPHSIAGTELTLTAQAMDRYQNPTFLVDPSMFVARVAQEQNASILQVFVNTSKGPVQPDIRMYLDTTRLGRVIWSIHCFVSEQYQIDIIYQGTTSFPIYQGSFSVFPANPSSTTSVVTIPSIAEAGIVDIEASLRDEWGNPTDAMEYLAIMAMDTGNAMKMSVYGPDLRDSKTLSYSAVLTVTGVYSIMAQLDGIAIKVHNVTIEPQVKLSLFRSQVTGYGAGAPVIGEQLSDATPVFAGNTYSFWVIARDMYGNVMHVNDGIASLSIDGPGEATVTMRCYQNNGTIHYNFELYISGGYLLTVHTKEGLLHQGMLRVRPGATDLSSTSIFVIPVVAAGDELVVQLTFVDKYGNLAYTTGSLLVELHSYDNQTSVSKATVLHEASRGNTSLLLTRAGKYAGICYLNNDLLGDKVFLVEVLHSEPITTSFAITGPSQDGILSIDITLLDAYGNNVLDSEFLRELDLVLYPDVNWEANMTKPEEISFRLTLWSEPGPHQRSLNVVFRNSVVGVYNWTMLMPSNMPDTVKPARPLQIAALTIGTSCFMCSIVCLATACLLNRKSLFIAHGN
uniref:Plus gametic plasma membrane protein homolog n=1 Tax=Yamagishiella unicocca TaxID=51707 RepID=A0A2Z5X8B9_9CHLO|nr:plus gametic plasma membrane protein homolog [Yamagishiella unicocca]